MRVSTCSYRPILEPCGLKGIDYQVDTYVGCGHYCYYCYAMDEAETDWRKEILIHEDITGQLSEELEKIPPQKIYLGYKTDPYQPCETEYRQTRQVLELFLEKGFSASILTKSDLVIRDIDLLKEMNSAAVSVSVAFSDNNIRRQFEANTINTEDRITALRQLKEAGVKTGALICPVIPYITDAELLIDMLMPYTDEIWVYGLSIRDKSGQNRQNIIDIFNNHFPKLKKQIETVIFSKDHSYWTQLRKNLIKLKEERQIKLYIRL